MEKITPEDVKRLVESFVKEKLADQGRSLTEDLRDDCDLLIDGFIDSLGVLELITRVEEAFQKEIDFESMDPEKLTIVKYFCEFVSVAVNKA